MKDYEWNEEFPTQKSIVRQHLLDGNSITPLEALNRFGIFRLAAVVHELREEGLPIITEKIQVSPRKRVAKYFIKPENLNN
jgi:hypothetical protein